MTSSASHLAFNPNHLDETAISQALARGEHTPVLQAYFGAAFAELTRLAQRAAAVTPQRDAPLVYLLPGLLGSKLGYHNRHGENLLWLDPLALIAGRLPQLAIGKRRGMRALGLMLPGYLQLLLTLQAAGLRVKVHAYDWRRSIVELGQHFAEQLLHEPAQEVMVVAHSMGGLVARAALKHVGSAKVTRLVQLGPPNRGSFALVQVLRGCYPTLRKLGAIDQVNSAEVLTQRVFRSFYSFYEMLPQPGSAATLFDVHQWPQDALLPSADRLKLGRRLPRHLAAADRRCHVIVGVGQPTVSGVRREQDEFIFEYDSAGDGTVPAALAQWSGASHWYVSEAHGGLPRSTLVCRAVIDLLERATTSELQNHLQPIAQLLPDKSETELRALLNCKVRWDQLPLNERRDVLEPVISPTFTALCANPAA